MLTIKKYAKFIIPVCLVLIIAAAIVAPVMQSKYDRACVHYYKNVSECDINPDGKKFAFGFAGYMYGCGEQSCQFCQGETFRAFETSIEMEEDRLFSVSNHGIRRYLGKHFLYSRGIKAVKVTAIIIGSLATAALIGTVCMCKFTSEKDRKDE